MKFRSLLMIGLGAAISFTSPSFAAGEMAAPAATAATPKPAVTAALDVKKPDTVKPKPAKKAKVKKSAKAKPAKPVEEVKVDKPAGLFAFFRQKPVDEAAPKKVDPKAKAAAEPKSKKVVEKKAAEKEVILVAAGNTGELRSEKQQPPQGFFGAVFGAPKQSALLPETRALDAVLAQKQSKKQFKVKPEYMPQDVAFSGYSAGTIVINTAERRLYLVESSSTARRYAIAVGRDGLQFKGTVAVGDKQEWPRWIPTLDMQKREPKHYGQYKDGMPGGGQNPLGARAIYLYDGKKDTHLRIHGTIAPQSIGTSASNGCFRMINEHVMDLYGRVGVGTKVIIL